MLTPNRISRRQFARRCAAAALVASIEWPKPSVAAPTTPRSTPYILGADVSSIPQDEAANTTFWDRQIRKDPLEILKSYHFNFIRLRIFVNPGASDGYAAKMSEPFCDLDHTRKIARRIRAAGMKYLLSFHYSDTWSSAAHQAKPAAWSHLNFTQLVDAVHDWTAKCVGRLSSDGSPPDMVSIGNETSAGMLFPEGRSKNFDNFAKLTNAGCLAVRELDPKIPIAHHHHLGRDNASVVKWVDNFLARKTEFDIMGMSCYGQAHSHDWENNFSNLATRYPNLSFLAMEYSYQKRFLNDLVFNAPNAKGLGSFIWDPIHWREAVFDHNGTNAGADFNHRPHLPASTLPPLDDPNQPTYRSASPSSMSSKNPNSEPATQPEAASSHLAGPRYDTNSFILAYPQMAKAYELI